MSLHNPSNRPWRRPAGARVVVYGAWALVAAVCAVSGWFIPPELSSDPSPDSVMTWTIAFLVALSLVVGVMFLDVGLARFRDASEASAVARMFGVLLGGTGIGALASDHTGSFALPAIAAALAGLLLFFAPWLSDVRRWRRERRQSAVRASGAGTTAVITDVRVFYRGGETPRSH